MGNLKEGRETFVSLGFFLLKMVSLSSCGMVSNVCGSFEIYSAYVDRFMFNSDWHDVSLNYLVNCGIIISQRKRNESFNRNRTNVYIRNL